MSDYLHIVSTLRELDLITEEQAERALHEVQEHGERVLAFRDEYRAKQSWWDRTVGSPNAWLDAWRKQEEAQT